MFTTFIGLIDIQSWWEVPCIAHFCSLFSTTFQLPKFDIEDLEEALLTDADAEGEVDLKVYTARLLPELIVALLKGCDALAQIGAHISPSNYQMFLRRLFRQKCQEYNVDNPFNTDTDFEKLPLRTKILILKYLCDFRLDSEDVSITFANYEADSLRLEPIGYDRKGSSYWHFFGTRLYREDFVSSGKSKSAKSSVWQVICFTEEDWRNLANKLDNSSNTKERNLHDLLVENFLPYIPKLFRDKERERRNRLLERPRLTRLKLLQEGKTLQLQEQFQKQQKEEEIDRERQTLSEVVQQKTLPLVPERAQLLSEARAKRAERRSRSNSVTSIVSPYDSSPDEASLLTRDFIFQPKENAFRSKANSSYLYRSTTNLRGSTSPSVGSLLEQQELLDHYDGSDVPRGTNSIRSVSSASSARSSSVDSRDQSNLGCNSSCGRSEDSESQYDSKPTIYHDSYYIVSRREDSESVHSFSDIEAENNINSGNTDTNNKQQLVESSETSSIIKPLCQQQTKTERKDRPVRVVSAEVEKLLRSNHNMAPTATKLPGRQTNNSLSSVTGPVILPFSDAAAKGTASNSGKGNDTAPGTNQGRKKKGKSANVITAATYTNTSFTKTSCSASSIFVSSSLSFTETDEVLQIGMHKVLESIKNHDDAWPFMDPVDEDIAPKYYSIIRRPMDLQKMEEKLDNGEYMMFSDFQNDFKLIVNNCRLYNGQANEYTEMVNNLQIAFERARKKYFDENSSDEELMSHEYPDVSRANAAFKEKVSSKESSKANSSDAVNGKSERQHSKPAKEAIYPKGGDYTKEKSKKSASSGANGNNSLSAKSNNTSSNANSKDSVEASCRGNDKPCKESKTKSVKSGTAVADKKGGKNVSGEKKHPATVGAVSKKHKTNKQPEVDSEPEPDPEPPEKDKSASRVNKTVKRKRKEKEKTDKAKSKKQKTEESDYSDMDVPENEENVDVKSEEDRECSEPERKRYKRDQVMEHAEPSKKLLGETDTITKGDSKMVEDVKEEEDFPVYESKKKAAIKALQEKEKKKNSAKVKKEEKKINKSPKGAKGKDVKSETFSPIRGRSISRSPSPSQDVSSPIKQSPDRSLSPKKRESARDLSSDTGDHNSVPDKTGSKKGKEKNGTESSVAHQKPHKKGSTIKTGSGIAVAKLDKKTKKSGTLSSGKGGKGRQKKAGSGKQKTVTDLEEEFDFEEMPHDRRDSVQIHTNGDRIDVTDVSDFEDIEDIRMKSHDNSVDESATNKSSEKTKSKKNKTNKKNIGKSSAHEHHRAKKNGSKSKGKDKKLDKKSHKRDKIGKGKKKSKASNHDRTIGEDRETMSSIGEDDDGIDYDQKMEEFGDVEKSASKPVKQSKNSRYHSAQRSVSRSPSPARSYYSDDRSIRDSEEEDDDAQNERGSSSNKQTDESLSANRSITPDIKDKFDLIKERRNRAAAAAAAAAEAKALAKQAKAKGKDVTATAGTGKKGKSSKSSSNRGHKQQRDIVEESTVPSTSASSSGSKQQHKKQQQQQHGEEDEKASGENKSVKAAAGTLTKGKKNRDKATSNSSESATVWAKPSDKKHTRPSSSSLSADSAKTVDRSNEYDFVDDSVAADSKADKNHPKSSNTAGNTSKTGKKSTVAVGSTAQTGTTSQKHPKSNAKAMPPSSGKHSKTTATSAASGTGAAGANMEELELETEQTLKDINKWLENTPRFPEYSSASNSPSRYIMDDFDTVPVKIEPADFRKPIPLSQLPAANDAPGGPLQGASPGLATMAAPPKAFSPRAAASAKDPQSTSSTSGKQPNTKLPSQPKDGANKSEIGTVGTDTITVATALKDSTNSSNGVSSGAGSSTASGKAAGSTSHTILGPPPIIPPHSQKKEPKEPKRKSLKEKLSLGLGVGGRKRDLHHHRTTIDRLQPGKTKGNLIGTIQNLNKPDELFPLGSSGGPGGNSGAGNNPLNKVKEVKNSLIVKTDESKPKLSLGTVLNTEGFGIVQQHNFADDENDSDRRSLGSKDDGGDEDDPITTIGSGTAKPLLSSLKATALVNVGGGSPISTREGGSVSKKDEPSSSATVTGEKPEASSDHVAVETKSATSSVVEKLFSQEDGKSGKEEANGKDPQCNKSKDKPSATPNLNAWIKAFGAPKKPKKSDDTEEPSKGSPVSDKGKINETTSTQSSSNESSSGIGSLPAVPGSLESPSYPTLPTVPRQRKASTGSTVSERSSYSQDPDSPRIGIDERLGAYPAPYPSPIGASPIMTSPKLDETQKSPYHPLNGAIKVGFYQDTTQKSSPEKSCSPRDLPSPYPQYSQHLYTSNAANTSGGTAGTNNNIGGNNAVYGNYSSYGTTTSAIGSTGSSVNQNNPSSGGVTDSFKGYGKELKSPVDFYDQYKQPASQESDYNSSMSPSTNPNSPYHNPASSPYQQQPNSPSCYQQQTAASSSPYGHQPPSLASPASSGGPLSPYNATAVPHSPATSQTTAASVSGHSPYNPNQGQSPYHSNQGPSASTSPSAGTTVGSTGQPKLQSKPNTPLHQSPNSPFSQSNQSSPYSQQDPNSPYSSQGGQLSPFQPMSPKPPASSAASSGNSNSNNAIKLAPPIITPQQAAAAAGVILPPESPVHSQTQSTPPSAVSQAQNLTGGNGTGNGGNNPPSSTPGTTIPSAPMQLNSHQSPWTAHHNQYNPYLNHPGDTAGGAASMASSLPPAPAHMPPSQQGHLSNVHTHPSPAHTQHQQHQQHQQQHPLQHQQQHQQDHQQQHQQNHQQAHGHHLATAQQQQQSHLGNLLMGSNNNPYTSTYGRPYDLNSVSASTTSAAAGSGTTTASNIDHHHAQHHPQHLQHQQQQHTAPHHQQQQQQHPSLSGISNKNSPSTASITNSSKVPEMINLGYSEPETNSTKPSQDVPMNMESSGGMVGGIGKEKSDGAKNNKHLQQQHQQQHQAFDHHMGGMGYGNPMDISISKSKAFDMFNRTGTMAFPRGFGAPGVHQPTSVGNTSSTTNNAPGGYDHRAMQQVPNMNKAHDMSGGGTASSGSSATSGYNMQQQQQQSAVGKSTAGNQHPTADQPHLPRYDQRSPQHLQQHHQQQQHGGPSVAGSASQASNTADLSSTGGGYKPYGASTTSATSASLMDPAIRNLSSLSSLYNPDDRLLVGGPGAGGTNTSSAGAGFYDKGMPPAAHMFSKNLSQPPPVSSSAATTSSAAALQQMFNNTMAATTMAAYNANREQPNAASYVPSPNYHHPQQHHQRSDMMSAGNIQSQKVSHNANVPPTTGSGASVTEPTPAPAKPKRTRKKKDQNQDLMAQHQQQQQQSLHQHAMHAAHQQQTLGAHQGFPPYPGLKPPNPSSSAGGGSTGMGSSAAAPGAVGNPSSSGAETSAISLKTANIVPGSAFNFGPGPTGLGLPPGSLYGDTSASTYLEDSYRNPQNPYYLPPSHRATTAAGSGGTGTEADKLGNPIGAQPAAPGSVAAAAAVAAASAAAVHGPPPPTAASPYHQFLASHHGTRPYQFMNQFDPLHQQYLRQEELRAQMMINQGLLGAPPGTAPSVAYGQPGYHHPAIGMHKPYDAMNSMNRSPFL